MVLSYKFDVRLVSLIAFFPSHVLLLGNRHNVVAIETSKELDLTRIGILLGQV